MWKQCIKAAAASMTNGRLISRREVPILPTTSFANFVGSKTILSTAARYVPVGSALSKNSVWIGPGLTVVTATPNGFNSKRKAFENLTQQILLQNKRLI